MPPDLEDYSIGMFVAAHVWTIAVRALSRAHLRFRGMIVHVRVRCTSERPYVRVSALSLVSSLVCGLSSEFTLVCCEL